MSHRGSLPSNNAARIVPGCHGFRLHPVQEASIVNAGVPWAPPFPVLVRDLSGRARDFYVYDEGFHRFASKDGQLAGPFRIDPLDEYPQAAWGAEWVTDEDDDLEPAGPSPTFGTDTFGNATAIGVGGGPSAGGTSLVRADRLLVAPASLSVRRVATPAGAAVAFTNGGIFGELDVTHLERLLIVAVNADAIPRAVSLLGPGAAWAKTLGSVPAGGTHVYAVGPGCAATGIDGALAMPLPDKVDVQMAAGATTNNGCSLTVYGR